MLTFTFLPWLKQERATHSLAPATGRGRKMIRPQTSSFLCKPWRWYADLAVGWHLKVVNCANLCFRLERSWMVRVFHHELTPHSPWAQLQIGEGGVVGFSVDRLIVAHRFSRWFMNIYMHKLFGKMKINLQLNGRWLGYLFSQRKKKVVFFFFIPAFRMSVQHFIFFIFLNVCISNYPCFFLIRIFFLLLHSVPSQQNISIQKCLC